MRRHGTNLTAVAAILGGTVLGAGATMALASAKHADRHGHGKGRQQTIIVCRSEGAVPTSASVTIEGTAGETSVTVTKQRPSRDRRHVRKRRRCRRIVTTNVSRHRDVSFEHIHAGATTPHFDRERVRARLEEARRRSQAARERLQQAQARAEEVQARAGDVQAQAQARAQEAQARAQVIREAMTELRGQAGSGIDSADLERLRVLLAEFENGATPASRVRATNVRGSSSRPKLALRRTRSLSRTWRASAGMRRRTTPRTEPSPC